MLKPRNIVRYFILFLILTFSLSLSFLFINSCSTEEKNGFSFNNFSIYAENGFEDIDIADMDNLMLSLALQEAYRNIVRRSLPAVVHITSVVERDMPSLPFWFPFLPDSPSTQEIEVYGSGFIISRDGYILTNNHVISNAKEVKVILNDGTEYMGEVLGIDPDIDVAMIKIDVGSRQLPILPLGDSDSLQIGDIIIAIGNPFGLDGTVTQGIVSAMGRYNLGVNMYENFIQIDAAINPGNSGGPLINLRGEVVGLNNAILSSTQQFAGIGLAIPINMVKSILDNLRTNEPIERGFLGISIQEVTKDIANTYEMPSPRGVAITFVEPGSPAQQAGLRATDIILDFDGKPINTASDLMRNVGLTPAGTVVPLRILRMEGNRVSEQTINVTIGKRTSVVQSDIKAQTWMGVSVTSMTNESKQRFNISGIDRGVIVTEVENNSLAARAGINRGDVILQINEYEIDTLNDFYNTLDKVEDLQRFRFVLYRRGTMFLVTIRK